MRDLIEPGIEADQIDGNGGEKMLEMRLDVVFDFCFRKRRKP